MMGYGRTYTKEDLYAAYWDCLNNGLNFFDTAESYAGGDSERLLGEFHMRDGRNIMIATKYKAAGDPKEVLPKLKASLERLKVSRIDLYQLHYPPQHDKIEKYMDAMAEAVKSGLARAVGVSNFNAERMKRAIDRLARHGIPLASNQVFLNLIERRAEYNGVLDLCKSEDVALIAFSPMAQGLLTGKFRGKTEKLSFSQRAYFRLQQLDMFRESPVKKSLVSKLVKTPLALKSSKLELLFRVMEDIAKKHNATIPQVALNWLLKTETHVIPIPGVKHERQSRDIIGTLDFTLSDEEYRQLCDVRERIGK
jgi:aryl-alcohol dehydrogenase-like predicted oxidoreductase